MIFLAFLGQTSIIFALIDIFCILQGCISFQVAFVKTTKATWKDIFHCKKSLEASLDQVAGANMHISTNCALPS